MAFHRGCDRELMARPSNLEATHSPKFFDPLRRGSASRSIRANFLLERAIDPRVAVVRILSVTFSRDGFHAMSFAGRLERADGDENNAESEGAELTTRKSSHRGTRG